MALFGGRSKQDVEQEVLQKLSVVPLLDLLVENVMNNEEEPWLHISQGFYDSCKREVRIEPDGFEIKWSSYHDEQYVGPDGKRHEKRVEKVHASVGYSYTKSGYLPLHGYRYDEGKKEIPTQRVCYLWACIIRERLAAKMPKCRFSNVTDDATFSYIVPGLLFKDWF